MIFVRTTWTLIMAFALFMGALAVKSTQENSISLFLSHVSEIFQPRIKKHELAHFIGKQVVTSGHQEIEANGYKLKLSINQFLQETIEKTYKTAKVKYGAFVAMDPTTGKVLAMVSHGRPEENMALRSSYPAASVFKIVTAAAAVEAGKLGAHSLIPVVGSYHTLYKRNIFKAGGIDPQHSPRYARLISFSEALAKSVNSVFGKVGVFGLGSQGVRKAAEDFAFNQNIPFEMPLDNSKSEIPNDQYGLAESASGFTRNNTLSPVHGAMIASAVANDGIMMEPSIVDSAFDNDGKLVYEFEPTALKTTIEKRTSSQLRIMLSQTITNGTSRGSFRGIARQPELADVYIGGKTGTLNGWDPPGRYDWFVGFADSGSQKIAVAALCIHGEYRGMKASKVARKAFETYFNKTLAQNGL